MQKTKKASKRSKRQKLNLVRMTEPKYLDTLSIANSIGSGGTLFQLTTIPQGDGQSTRVGDFSKIRKLLFNFTLYIVNSDIITTVRLIFFRWVVSTAISSPSIANILEAPASSNVLSHFNFQLQDNYHVLWEKQFQGSGITTSPTDNSNFGATGLQIPLGSSPEIEFALGAASGTNHLYLLAVSDSALAPFPLLNFSSRVYFEDTFRSVVHSLVK